MKIWRVRHGLCRGARDLGDVQAVAYRPKAVAKCVEGRPLWQSVAPVLRKM